MLKFTRFSSLACFSMRFEYDALPEGREHLIPLSTRQHKDCSGLLLRMGKVGIFAVEALMMPPFTKPGFKGGVKLFMPLGSGLMTITQSGTTQKCANQVIYDQVK